ncbi:hypothetical protein RND71_000446 [Anisodus tanguticus]|uniref:Nitronate monooxygenase domain-containing protein n=1 Tax=Anisodus tanguticus TaxID=243964 RepID=A0AAE1SXC4_9SOLA|nr:hypothetical protein RND71_000446 [Anisodus tanguticus]
MGFKGILGFEYGIVQAPLGPDISGPELVANAGGLGLLRAPDWEDPDYVRELIRKTRTLTNKPFGIGVILAFPHKKNVKAILDEKVAVLQLYWGECSKQLVLEAHKAGVKVVPQIGSYEEAKKAADAGVDAIIVQGLEAGGHVIGQDGLIALLPRVVDLVRGRDIAVIAAGGIVDERGYVAALALGAQGVSLGTRFLATEESYAHPTYKKKLIEFDQTEYTDIFVVQGGQGHHIVFWQPRSSWNGRDFQAMRMSQINLSLAAQSYMAGRERSVALLVQFQMPQLLAILKAWRCMLVRAVVLSRKFYLQGKC